MDGAIIKKFCDITGAENDEAVEFLSRASMNIDEAIALYYEDDRPKRVFQREHLEAQGNNHSIGGPTQVKRRKHSKLQGSNKAKVSTLHDINKSSSSSSDENDDDEEYFIGGAEKSGQVVIKPNNNHESSVNDLFKNARRRMASQNHESQAYGSQNDYVADGTNDRSLGANSSIVELTVFQNGFLWGDQEFRSFSDPNNIRDLEQIKQGLVPASLSNKVQSNSGHVRIILRDKRTEEYVPSTKSFCGTSRVVGSPAPNVVSTTVTHPPAPILLAQGPSSSIKVDDSQPTGRVAVTFPSGTPSRLIINLNPQTHTMYDIYQHVASHLNRPSNSFTISLNTSPAVIAPDNTKTIHELGICGYSLSCSL